MEWKYFLMIIILLILIGLAFYIGYRFGINVVNCDMIHYANDIYPPYCGKIYP